MQPRGPGRGDPKFLLSGHRHHALGFIQSCTPHFKFKLGTKDYGLATKFPSLCPFIMPKKKSGREPGDDIRFAVSHSLPVLPLRDHLSTLPSAT